MNKTLFMLVGLPCSGKSTFLSKIPNKVVVDTDSTIEEYARSHDSNYNDCFKDCIDWATKVMNEKVQECVRNGTSFYWDQTNLTVKSRKRKLAAIPKDWTKVAIVFETPIWEIERRMKLRDKKVPMDVVYNMQSTYERPTTDEGFDSVIDWIPEDTYVALS